MKYSALIGNPVEHSLSPQLFYLLTRKLGIEYSHIKIKVNKSNELEETINSLCKLKFVGFNITCPYKLKMFRILGKNNCDLETQKINSINSIVIKNGKIKGYNTDGRAALMAITSFYKISKDDKIVLLGAGGVAYSIFFELSKITNKIVVFNENIKQAKKMCKLILPNTKYYNVFNEEILCNEINNSTIVINATSVGMFPNSSTSLISEKLFRKIENKKCFFDVVFNPLNSKMLTIAKKYNHLIISGKYMLVYQAILSLNIWLNNKIVMKKNDIDEVLKELELYYEENYN